MKRFSFKEVIDVLDINPEFLICLPYKDSYDNSYYFLFRSIIPGRVLSNLSILSVMGFRFLVTQRFYEGKYCLALRVYKS